MSNAGTTNPARTWVSSQPPTYTAQTFETKKHDSLNDNNDTLLETKYNPERPGSKLFTERTLNTYKKRKKPGILKGFGKTDDDKPQVRFQDDESREIVTARAPGVQFSTTKPYESIIAERDALLETEGAYRRRIQQLEEENTRILLDYDGIYKENNILRDKLDKGDDNHIESYQRIYEDRKILREAETAYKRRINQLESDAKDMLKNFESLYSENKVLRDKAKKLEERLNAIDRLDDVKKIHELEKKVKLLEKTVRTMGYERQDLVKENHEIENQMFKMREEISDLTKQNLMLERENEGFKRGFMALGKNMDENWKDGVKMKTRRQEEEERRLKEEHAIFKTDLENLGKEMHKLEKVNIELKTRNELLEENKKENEIRLLELAREQSKRTPSAVKRRDAELEKAKEQKLEELRNTTDALKIENVALKTKVEMMEKEKETFDEILKEASSKQPRETASSIRRKMETEREIRDLNMHVENFKEKNKRLEVENADLKAELDKLEVETKVQRQASKALASDKAKQTDGQMKDLNAKVIELNTTINSLTEENLKFKAEYNQLEDKLQRQIETITKARDDLKKEKEEIETNVKDSNSTASETINELKDELNSVKVELKLTKVNLENATASLDEIKGENKTITIQLEEKRTELENLRETIRSNRDVYFDLSNAQRENATLKREIDNLHSKAKTDSLKQEAELEELLKNQEFMNSALADHKIRLDMLQQEKNDLKDDNINLIKANERQAKTIGDLQVDLQKAESDNSTKMKSLSDELEEAKKELKMAEKDIIETRQELEITKNERENQVKKLMTQMEKLKNEREIETQQLKHQSESLRSEVARLKVFEQRIESMESNLKDLVSKLKESEERNKQISTDKLSSLQQVVSEMKSENLANRIRAAEREQNELEKHKLELEIKEDALTEIRKLKAENNRLLGLLEDKRISEDAKDEWTRKRNKFNEVLAQNKRLQDENKRVLELFENSQVETMKKDLKTKTELMKTLEAKYHQLSTENDNLKKAFEEKEFELRNVGAKADRSHRLHHENNKLKAENQKLKGDITNKDHQIAKLKELEVTKAKYVDAAANNQRLYEENMRLRELIDKSKDYKSEFQRLKGEEMASATQKAKYMEENVLLKSTLQVKELELRREVELHKDKVASLQVKNKNLTDEVAKLKKDIAKKDDLILKLKDLESAGMKLKDAGTNITRLYEENQRLRNLLENNTGGWKSNFQNAKTLSDSIPKDVPVATATYVDPKTTTNQTYKQTMASVREQSSQSEEGTRGNKTLSKPLLPDIRKDSTGLTFGLSYKELHQKTKGLKGEKLIETLKDEVSVCT